MDRIAIVEAQVVETMDLFDRGDGEDGSVLTTTLGIKAKGVDGAMWVFKAHWSQASVHPEDGFMMFDPSHREDAEAMVANIMAKGDINPDHWEVAVPAPEVDWDAPIAYDRPIRGYC